MSQGPRALASQVKIRLRQERFNLITRILGCGSEAARARLFGVDYKTISRVRSGSIGEQFIAQAMAVLQHHAVDLAKVGISTRFEELFEVVEDEAAA